MPPRFVGRHFFVMQACPRLPWYAARHMFTNVIAEKFLLKPNLSLDPGLIAAGSDCQYEMENQ